MISQHEIGHGDDERVGREGEKGRGQERGQRNCVVEREEEGRHSLNFRTKKKGFYEHRYGKDNVRGTIGSPSTYLCILRCAKVGGCDQMHPLSIANTHFV